MHSRSFLVVCCLFANGNARAVHSQEQKIPVSEDAWIEVGASDSNRGDGADLQICPRAGYWIYLKFDLSGIEGTVTDARLQMKRFNGSRPEEISVYAITEDSWQENGIDGIALPVPQAPATEDTLAMGIEGEDADTWTSTQLTGFIQEQAAGDGVVSLMVREDPRPNFDVRRYFSREGARDAEEVPQLILQIEAGPPPAAETVGAAWRAVDVGVGVKPSFDFAPDGRVHVMGMTESTSGVVWHASATTPDGPWEPQTVATGYFYGPGDIVVSDDGTAHLAWHDHDQQDASHAAIPLEGDPVAYRIETPDTHDGWDNPLALASDGRLHQSSVNPVGFGATTSLQHSVFEGDGWTAEDVPGSGPFMYGLNTSIAIDREGYPHIAYCTATDFRAPGELRYAYKNADGWTVTPAITSGPVAGRFPSLALDHWDRPHIAWIDGDSNDESLATVHYAVLNNDVWELEELDAMKHVELSFSEARKSVSLALDGLWQPHLAFGDRQIVKYARKVFGEWEIEKAIEHAEPSYKGLVVLRLSPNGKPAIAFWQRHDELPGLVRLLARSVDATNGRQLPGDCTGDATLNISDAVCLLERLFFAVAKALPCAGESTAEGGNAALFDANADAAVGLADAVSVLAFLFLGGPPHTLGTECTTIEGCGNVCPE